ncbi:MAG: hypothetical protein Q7T57_08080, partial [Dehalococcoidales bacterium]|nr:hypothetical protein [Dehalococcoidales bacterium]
KRVVAHDSAAPPLPVENKGLFLPVQRTQHKIASKDRFAAAPPADTSALFASLTGARLMRAEHAQADEETEIAEGLGRLPAYLPSISSVLLFNSDENPYKQYVTINNLEGVGGQDRAQESGGPSAAPRSLIDGLELPTYAGFTFEYKPLLGELPQFDLPQNLPLGKLADITFGAESALSIAPSMATLALPSLDLPALTAMPTRQQVQSAVPASTHSTSTSSSSSIPAAPATTSSVPAAPSMSSSAAPVAPPMSSHVPPPPGPPTAPPSAPANVPAAVAKPSGGRGALLDAIRDAKNAKKLKAVKPGAGAPGAGRPTGGKIGAKVPARAGGASASKEGESEGGDAAAAPAKKAPAADSGDMMDALRNRLAMRAVAMSGKVDLEGSAQKPVMAARRPSVAPRLNPVASLVGRGAPKAPTKAAADAVDEGEEKEDPKMSSAVMSAYVAAHAKKQEKDEEWD